MITKHLDSIVVAALVLLSVADKSITPWIVLIPLIRPLVDFGTKVLTNKSDAISSKLESRISDLESAMARASTKKYLED